MLYNKSVQALKKGCDLICLLLIIYNPSNIKGEFITNFYRKDDSLIYEVRASCYRTYLSLLRTYYEIHKGLPSPYDQFG